MQPSSTGNPERSDQLTALNFSLSGLFDAKTAAICSCSWARKWIANIFECSTAESVRAVRSKHTITSGGSRDSEVKALTVSAEGPSEPKLVTTETPVTNCLHTSRK